MYLNSYVFNRSGDYRKNEIRHASILQFSPFFTIHNYFACSRQGNSQF